MPEVSFNPTLWSLKLRTQQRLFLFHSLDQDRQAYLFILFWLIYFAPDVEQSSFSVFHLQADSFTWDFPTCAVASCNVSPQFSHITSTFGSLYIFFTSSVSSGSSERVHYICSGTDRRFLVHQAACPCCFKLSQHQIQQDSPLGLLPPGNIPFSILQADMM